MVIMTTSSQLTPDEDDLIPPISATRPTCYPSVHGGSESFYMLQPLSYREVEAPARPQARGPQEYRELIAQMIEQMIMGAVWRREIPLYRVSYPGRIVRDLHYARGYQIPDFAGFFGEEDIAQLEHIAHFTHQSGRVSQSSKPSS